MREITITSGKNKGVHYVFESTTEAIDLLSGDLASRNTNCQDMRLPIDRVFPHWWEGGVGDWVKCDDGYITQCMNRWEMVQRGKNNNTIRYSNGMPMVTFVYKFVFGIYRKQLKKDGTLSGGRCLGAHCLDFRGREPSSMAGKSYYLGKYKTHRKMLFAYKVAISGDPVASLLEIIDKFKLMKQKSHRVIGLPVKLALTLMQDPYVIEEIKRWTTMDEFKDKLSKACEKYGADADAAIQAISELTKNGRGLVRLQAAQTQLKIARYIHSNDDTLALTDKDAMQTKQVVEKIVPMLPDLPDTPSN